LEAVKTIKVVELSSHNVASENGAAINERASFERPPVNGA